MNKEELIGKLQMVYVGDRNALNELIGYYDGLKQGIEELQQENKQLNQLLKDKGFIIDKLMEENRQLKENRNKAIKYIKTTNFWGLYDDTPMEEVKYGEDLLEILKGENK